MGDDLGRLSGRRSVDDGARLLIAERTIEAIRQQFVTLAEGAEVISSVLLGALHKDGTTTPGLVQRVDDVRAKQDENGQRIAEVLADMGDLKTAQADQGRVLDDHGTKLDNIGTAAKLVVTWVARGVIGALGLGALDLLAKWWATIVLFFTTWGPHAAAAATKGHF